MKIISSKVFTKIFNYDNKNIKSIKSKKKKQMSKQLILFLFYSNFLFINILLKSFEIIKKNDIIKKS